MATATPDTGTQLKTLIYAACYSSSDPLQSEGPYTYQSSGYCQKLCVETYNKPVMGLTEGSDCWCGDKLPANSTKVDDSKCNNPCTGFDKEKCGGHGYWQVFLTGTQNNIDSIDAPSSTPSGSKSAPTSVVTVGGSTVTVVNGASGSSSAKSGSKAGIAAGAVVGIIAVAAIIGGVWFFLRARKRRAVEEEYRRNATINSFTQKPGSTSSISDSRLEPSVMMQRRMSDGSIADNQDYSRRILKVTNPDGS
ncbi:MAG: hypothetical protein M1839_008636 [Geoglossum umbratile]|nr:MAG: hypothetical protein M1839_008636 [Geoglossum umbratile]